MGRNVDRRSCPSQNMLRFWCGHCERTFNERTGTLFNFLEVPTDIMFQVLLWRVTAMGNWSTPC